MRGVRRCGRGKRGEGGEEGEEGEEGEWGGEGLGIHWSLFFSLTRMDLSGLERGERRGGGKRERPGGSRVTRCGRGWGENEFRV